jgi:tetratricopeptide (TPR) repeat protein
LALLLPFALYLAGVALLGDFIIDDAGISFAYARNLARGFGFVSQPGRAPVEGFSDFLWVLALVPTFWLRLFHPVLTPKLLSALAVLGGFALLQRALFRRTASLVPGAAACAFLAVSPPILVWTASGLENGLLLLLVCALFAVIAERSPRWPIFAGALAALLAMTRPDGLVFAPAVALIALAEPLAARRGARAAAASLGRAAAAFAAIWGPFLAYRLSVFHLPWPHPYYAKRELLTFGDRLRHFAAKPDALRDKLADFGAGLAGPAGVWILLATFAAVAVLVAVRRLPFALWAAAVIQAAAVAAYVLLDADWMGEHRFATAAIAASWITAALAAHAFAAQAQRRFAGALVVAFALGLAHFAPRLVRFAENPPTSYADVAREARRFNAYAGALGLARGSILTADLGGALMESRLGVIDAAGLCEPEVVRTLKPDGVTWAYDHPRFYAWVLGELRPTFVTTRKFWSNVTALSHDPRFARDYVAINAYDDPYVRAAFGRDVRSGDFVRRDALPDAGALERLRALHEGPRPEAFVVRLAEGLGKPAAETPLAELRAAAAAAAARHDAHRAASLFSVVLGRAPGDRDALLGLADALDDAGRSDEARAPWTSLLASGDPEARGRAVLRLSNSAGGAEAELATLMESGLAALYGKDGQGRRPAEAIALFQRVLAASPRHYGATYQLAVALDAAGLPDDARALWERVLPLAEGFGDAATAAAARARLAR